MPEQDVSILRREEMEFREDSRIRVARRALLISWAYFALYLFFYMGSSYTLGIKPYVFGLPRWVSIGNLFFPFLFVVMLIFVAEKFIPDVPLTDDEKEDEEGQ